MTAKTVLLVEDNADELMIYSTLLSHHGYRLLTAEDVGSALDVARRHHPDVAVVDINLGEGELDGTDFIEAMQRDDELRSIPVIVHSAFVDWHRGRLHHLGAPHVLAKPTLPSELLARIALVTAGPQGDDPLTTT